MEGIDLGREVELEKAPLAGVEPVRCRRPAEGGDLGVPRRSKAEVGADAVALLVIGRFGRAQDGRRPAVAAPQVETTPLARLEREAREDPQAGLVRRVLGGEVVAVRVDEGGPR